MYDSVHTVIERYKSVSQTEGGKANREAKLAIRGHFEKERTLLEYQINHIIYIG